MALPILLLAAQASGMIVDYFGTRNQIRMGRMGRSVEEAGINASIEMTRAESEEASVAAMQNLRQTLASQAAIFAARGTRAGVGSALTISEGSVGEFNQDEKARRMNLLAREAQLRAGNVLSGLHQLTSETQLGQSMTKRWFDKIPTDPTVFKAFGKKIGDDFKSTFGFGMTPVGS